MDVEKSRLKTEHNGLKRATAHAVRASGWTLITLAACLIAFAQFGCARKVEVAGFDKPAWTALMAEGTTAEKQKDLDLAEKKYFEALRLTEKVEKPGKETADTLERLADLYAERELLQPANLFYRRTIEILETMPDRDAARLDRVRRAHRQVVDQLGGKQAAEALAQPDYE